MQSNDLKYLFCNRLREERMKSRKTLGDVARYLGKSISYISDVERGNRMPFQKEDIEKFANLTGADEIQLKILAAQSRGFFTLNADGISSQAQKVGVALMRKWTHLDEEKLRKIERLLEED